MKWIGLGIGLLLLVLFASQLSRHRIVRGQNDFLQFYGGAKLSGTGELHSIEAMRAVQQREAQIWLPAVQYVRPDYYAVLLRPLGWLPFPVAYAAFQLLNFAALIGFVWLFRDRVDLKWLIVISIPLLVSFANGQDVPLVLFLLGLGFRLEQRGWPILAGVCLALCTIKVHFLVFLPVVLLLRRKWRWIASGTVTMMLLVAIAAWSEGWDWLLRYPTYLRRPEIHPDVIQFLNLRGIALVWPGDLGSALMVLTAAGVLLVLVALWFARFESLEHSLAIALFGGLMVSFHLGVHDCALLLLVAALAARGSDLAIGATALSFPLVYFLLLADGWVGALPALGGLALLLQISLRFVKLLPHPAINSSPAALNRYGS